MFVYAGNGDTDGPHPITNKEFFREKSPPQYTQHSFLLTPPRACVTGSISACVPDGRLGEVCLSLDGMMAYYEKRARDWELQMLIKARVAAGDPIVPGRLPAEFVDPKIYQSTLDFSSRRSRLRSPQAHRRTPRQRMANKQSSDPTFDVKLARGGIRDIEFLVQCSAAPSTARNASPGCATAARY